MCLGVQTPVYDGRRQRFKNHRPKEWNLYSIVDSTKAGEIYIQQFMSLKRGIRSLNKRLLAFYDGIIN
jgi:hypothetical protein